MANLLDYIAWRGDLTFAQAPFNAVDGLVLSQFAYIVLDGLAPQTFGEQQPLHETVTELFSQGTELHQTPYMWENNQLLAKAMAGAARYAHIGVTGYASNISHEEETQFAAITFLLPDETAAIAFRGTDDSLAGWKEDLNMAFDSPVPAQIAAARYLKEAAQALQCPLRVMGHSKGGNLAVYAVADAEPRHQDQVITLINFDGPGMAEHIWNQPGYQRIRGKMAIYFPHFAVVGMLLEYEETYQLVHSDATGLMQHDPFSWQVMGCAFEIADAPNSVSLGSSQVVKKWLATLTTDERRLFVDTIYDIATAGGDEKLSQFDLGSIRAIIRKTRSLDDEVRSAFHRQLLDLFSTAVKHVFGG